MWQKIKNIYHFAQAFLAAFFYQFPSKTLIVIGVTGTDGKTTTVNMIYHILKSAGKKASVISSVGAQIGSKSYDTGFHVSTPSPMSVQSYLKKAKDAGSEYFVLEATSHGLDQNRLAFVDFQVGILTNITHEHLDYHKTYQNYRDAKLKLFKNVKFSIINADDSSYDYVKNHVSGKIVTYSANGKGDYNYQNAQAAICAVGALGISRQSAQKALTTFPGVRGRMEEVKMGQPFKVLIDFAHTPNGLENALKVLRSQLTVNGSRLIAVFGAAGERYKAKRQMMGKAADKYAHLIILTSEDPRSEDPKDIAEQIAKGIKVKKYEIIPDRQKAIESAIEKAKSGDVVAIFGKGHEKSMNIGGKEYPWSDFDAVKSAIKSNGK